MALRKAHAEIRQRWRSMVKVVFSEKNLLLTNTVTSGVLLAGADVIEQEIEKKRKIKTNYDFFRTGEE